MGGDLEWRAMNSAGAVRSERPNGSDNTAACHEWPQVPGAEWSTFHSAHLMLTIPSQTSNTAVPISQMRKATFREVQYMVPGHPKRSASRIQIPESYSAASPPGNGPSDQQPSHPRPFDPMETLRSCSHQQLPAPAQCTLASHLY